MKPPPQGIVWSARTRRCPRCNEVVHLAWVVWHADGTRSWSCWGCLTPADLGGNGQPIQASATPPIWYPCLKQGHPDHPGDCDSGYG